jgi:HlyD family secretion protein
MLAVVGILAMAGMLTLRLMKSSSEPVKHLTHTITRGGLSVTVTENGAVESSNNKEIKCLVQGGSTVLWVIDTGTIVKPGDELVRLDQSKIEDKILQQRIVYETALANKITAESDVAVAEISITEYLEGTYQEDRSTIEKDIFEAEQNLRKAELSHQSMERLAAKGIVKSLQLEGEQFSVDSARKDLELKKTKLLSLDKYNKEKKLQELKSTLKAAQAKLASFEASLELEKTRLTREEMQLENCVIKADTAGMVIFPSMAAWKDTPDIEEGATVREQQTLLMIPDVSQMQVKVGIHESKVERLKVGMTAKVQLQELTLEGTVGEIAEVTRPAGWWTGNVVKYDTIIKLEPHSGLKPGMSAIVDVVLAKHDNVLTIPVAAIVESGVGFYCWVQTADGEKQRVLKLGDSNDEFTVVLDGLSEGEQVVLNPLAFIEEAQALAIQPDAAAAQSTDKKATTAGLSTAKQL